jgi:hypothetical protein
MSPLLCNPFKKNSKIAPSSPSKCNKTIQNKKMPNKKMPNKKMPNNSSIYDTTDVESLSHNSSPYDSTVCDLTEDYYTPKSKSNSNSNSNSKSSFELNINSNNYDNNIIEKIYVQLLDNEKRIKRLNFYIDRLDKDTKNKMDILYEIEEKIDLYDLKLNKILHIRDSINQSNSNSNSL